MSYYLERKMRKIFKKLKAFNSIFITALFSSIKLRKKYPRISSFQKIVDNYFIDNPDYRSNLIDSKSLDLGCGQNPRNPFLADVLYGIDIREDLKNNILKSDLSRETIPFETNMFDYCTAFDFIEHIPRLIQVNGDNYSAFIELINQIYRILKPGGLFLHVTPAYPSKEVFQDPTHVNFITEDTFPNYFCSPNNWASDLGYGFKGDFDLIKQYWIDDIWIASLMRAKK
tara:strand:- start:197 stop:880 length:684 start_codon:yes stop_codon:yes gene_type:complete